MNYQLDLRHYRCPLPLMMTKKALQQLPQGAILSVDLSPNTLLADFSHLAEKLGVAITARQNGENWRFTFHK